MLVELMASGTYGSPEYTIELDGPSGKLGIPSKGAAVADLAEPRRALWGLTA